MLNPKCGWCVCVHVRGGVEGCVCGVSVHTAVLLTLQASLDFLNQTALTVLLQCLHQ